MHDSTANVLISLCAVELFYYGAPGEFVESELHAAGGTTMPSYSEVAKKNAPIVDDDFFDEDFEPIARPYVSFALLAAIS